jgi:hypothetical protein
MEALTQLMSLIDLNSKSLPEGEYLKACNYMKDIYKCVPRPTSPEAALPRINTDRQPLPPSDSDSEDEEDDLAFRPIQQMRDELADVTHNMTRSTQEIRRRESRLRYLKIKQRVTAAVRRDAVRERAQQLGIRLREYTMEELRAKGHNVPDERGFYRGYLERQNLLTRDIITDLKDEVEEIKRYKETLEVRYRDLHQAIYGHL